MPKKLGKKPATLRDVAAAAGVSTMTVSNMLLGRVGRLSEATRQRIENEIATLGYRPHSMARSLRTSKWLTIGLLIADDTQTFLAGGFMANLVAGLSNYLNEQGYALLLQGVDSSGFKNSLMIRDIRTDGICAFLSGSDSFRRDCMGALLQLHQPIVVFQENLRLPGKDLCVIRLDDRNGGRMLAEELVQAGAKRLLVLVTKQNWPGIAERVAGVRSVVRKGGATLRVIKSPSMEFFDVQATIERDIAKNGVPDAVLAANDHMGIAAMRFLMASGLKVPRDVVVTGFNAFEFWQYTDPALTSVRSPAYEMGVRGGRAILERLQSGTFRDKEIIFPVELLRGGSTRR